MTEHITLTTHERHARLVKIVRKTWQAEHDGARLFVNTSGVAWQGNAVSGAGKVELLNPRPVFFGIPAPDGKGCGATGVSMVPEFQVSRDVDSLPILKETTLEEFMGDRFGYNQGILSNMISLKRAIDR